MAFRLRGAEGAYTSCLGWEEALQASKSMGPVVFILDEDGVELAIRRNGDLEWTEAAQRYLRKEPAR